MSKQARLASNRSPRWAFMETFVVPDYDSDGSYLTRLRIIQTPWFGIYLHKFDGPDPRTTLHDHPWPFISLVLRGGYVERRLNTMDYSVNENHSVRWINVMHQRDSHAITRLLRVPTWTFMLVGKRTRTWGYLEPTGGEWEAAWKWTPFDKHPHAREFDEALKRRR